MYSPGKEKQNKQKKNNQTIFLVKNIGETDTEQVQMKQGSNQPFVTLSLSVTVFSLICLRNNLK